ncbi:uncharacterized protein LOC117410977 isoform X2 [Acipenser ruthenus]|uniref:uncharacterized protein LOC117410977 isoform X2 n=1 Tax=Acipenser ruthenus TaxID=7906 RepID=UPI00274138BA|nr:uncharacterized protein LOC117410977 isoform X2 [Acipenser ruthenus]
MMFYAWQELSSLNISTPLWCFLSELSCSQNQDGKRRKDLRTRAACLVQQRSLVICWMKIQDRSLTILALMQSQTKLKQTSSSSSGRLSEMTGCVAGMPKLYGRRRRCSRERNLWESSKQENKTCISKRVACISDGQCERFSKCVACISDGQCERFSKCF